MVEIVGVGFMKTGKTYYFDPGKLTVTNKDHVIVETARGLEFGRVTLGNRLVKATDIVSPLKRVVRLATPEDIKKNEDNRGWLAEFIKSESFGQIFVSTTKLATIFFALTPLSVLPEYIKSILLLKSLKSAFSISP